MSGQMAAIDCKGERIVYQPVVKGSGRAGEICGILKSLGPVAAARVIGDLLFSTNHYYMLGRSLAAPLDYPFARRPDLPLVPLDESHIARVRQQLASLDPVERREVVGRLHFHASGFTNCYVMTAGEEIAYLQWLILPAENDIIRERFSTKFYPLGERQVMVENVFTFPKFRGRGLLPYGTLHLLQLARDKGFSSVVCYIRKDNITSLNEFFRMGFKITKMVQEYKVLGRTWRTL
jgi:hypothetical protein